MYVRRKTSRSSDVYQLVESRRVDGEPRQRVLLHLGRYPSVDDALAAWPQDVKQLHRRGRIVSADSLQAKHQRLQKMRETGVV